MANDEIKIVQDLIDNSRLIKDEEKTKMKEYIKTLGHKELQKARTHLEGEDNFILKAFGDSIAGTLDTNPSPEFIKEMTTFFLKVPKTLLKAREKDSRKKETENLEYILEQIPKDGS